jgi:hypothetical protein
LRPELLEKAGQRQDSSLYVFMQREELGFELIANLDNPAHFHNMTFRSYDVNYIYQGASRFAPKVSQARLTELPDGWILVAEGAL